MNGNGEWFYDKPLMYDLCHRHGEHELEARNFVGYLGFITELCYLTD